MPETLPVIILHGWSIDPDKEQKWQVFRDALTQKGISSKLLKIPGLSAPLQEVWDLENYVHWLDEELASESKVILLGHSFGGQVAIRYSATHPDKIAKLILVDSSGIRDHSLMPTIKRSIFLVMAKIGKVFFRHQIFRSLLYKLARERDYQQAPPLLRRTMSKILDDEVIADLPQITSPTLIVWGKEDVVTPLFIGEIFAKKIPHTSMKIVNGARHSPQYTHPQEVAQIVEQFLDQGK